MKAVKAASAHWPREAVHFEYFGADPEAAPAVAAAGGASVRLAKSGATVEIGAGQTILQALRAAGVACESSCESGLCGACKVRYVEGSPEHNDYVLSEDERKEYVLVCCAGVGAEALALDL